MVRVFLTGGSSCDTTLLSKDALRDRFLEVVGCMVFILEA